MSARAAAGQLRRGSGGQQRTSGSGGRSVRRAAAAAAGAAAAAHLRLCGVAAQPLAVLDVPALHQVLHDVAVVGGVVHCRRGGRGEGRGGACVTAELIAAGWNRSLAL